MKKFSELSLSCKAGIVVAVVTAPVIVYKSAKLAYKWYQHKYRKIYVSKPEVIQEENTDIEVNL
jgi:hypothetical protein